MWENKPNYIISGNSKSLEMNLYHLVIAPSFHCNFRCRHCYLPNYNADIMNFTALRRLLQSWRDIVLADRGQYGGIVHIKGGEPLILKYFNNILKELIQWKNLRFMLTTNGSVIEEETFSLFEKYYNELDGNIIINVSLEGATEKTNDHIRGKGSFKMAIRFIKELTSRGIPTHINTVVNNTNISEIENLVELAKKQNVAQINFLPFIDKGAGSTFKEGFISPKKIYQTINHIYKEANENTKKMLTGSIPDLLNSINQKSCRIKECVAGYRGFYYVIPNGNVFSCPNLMETEYSIGNINSDLFAKIHSENIVSLYKRLNTLSKCKSDFSCKGAIDYYTRTDDQYMIQQNVELNEMLNVINTSNKDEAIAEELAFCFSRNI